jgi:hypothetical protein
MRSVRMIGVAIGATRVLLFVILLALLLLTGEGTALAADGDLDTSFNDRSVNGTVNALALQSDGKVLIGGYFTLVGGTTMRRVARLNADGARDTSFNDPNADNTVYELALQSDWKVLIGGDFTSVGGTTMRRVARLENAKPTAVTLASFGAQVGQNSIMPYGLLGIAALMLAAAFVALRARKPNPEDQSAGDTVDHRLSF